MDGPLLVGYAEPVDKTPTETRRRWWSLKRLLIAAAALAFVSAVAGYGDYYWTTGRFLVSTDDAYVQAHSVLISPHISGYISEVPVDDNQRVKAGEVIARIDPRDYQTALDQARANVAAAQASIDTLNQQIAQQKLTVEQAGELVASDQAALTFSQQNFQRYTDLAKTGYGTVQRAQQAAADIREKAASLQHDTAGVGAAEKQIGVFKAQLAQAKATLAQQQAVEHQAELDLSYMVKTKCLNREEFVVVGWTDPEGARPYLGALLLAYYDDSGRLIYAGRVGAGIADAELERLWRRLQPLATDNMPLVALAAADQPIWFTAGAFSRALGPTGTRGRGRILDVDGGRTCCVR